MLLALKAMQAFLLATMALPAVQADTVGVGDGTAVNVGTGVDEAIVVDDGFGVRVGPKPGIISTPS